MRSRGSNDGDELRDVLRRLSEGTLGLDEAERLLRPTADLGFARVDRGRAIRCGTPEVVYCPGKLPSECARIAREIADRSGRVLLTRVAPDQVEAVRAALPGCEYHERARCATFARAAPEPRGLVAVVTAGTSDIAVAEEAAVTASFCGSRVERHFDVGVAGLHRLIECLPRIREARAVIAVAGMEGALPSVLAGQIENPVIAVPTSVGYGASFAGLAPLLAMLNSCAAGVAAVNIDNGFGAGYLASRINLLAESPGGSN
ncbi:MAG: nickel pincer cofactor biosynthesis protein LarB [Planctomycetota bacterium]